MTGLLERDYVTVIMDGSNKEVVDDIRLTFDLVTQCEIGGTRCHPLSTEHPTIMVIETNMTKETYSEIKWVIERTYPGLCLFNVRIA